MKENGFTTQVETPRLGKFWRYSPLLRFSHTWDKAEPGMLKGQHTEAILRELDYGPEQINALRLPSTEVNMDDPQADEWVERHGDNARHVEVEAMNPRQLVDIVRDAIKSRIDFLPVGKKLAAQKRNRREIKRRLMAGRRAK